LKDDVMLFNNPALIIEKTTLVERFLDYVRVDTRSEPDSPHWPSTPGQRELAEKLSGELDRLGSVGTSVDANGYVYSKFPGNTDAPPIGLLAHLDTSPSFSGSNVDPVLHENYDGGIITLGNGITVDPAVTPELKDCDGDTIITGDGTTLLGADDKAGIAEIMTALEILSRDELIARPPLCIGFTPDEEIGRGADRFDCDSFGAHAAYTIDGGFTGEFNSETFSGDRAIVTIRGVAVHLGRAKGKMVNALDWAVEFLGSLPPAETPQETDERLGFYHPVEIRGDAAEVSFEIILRDFDDGILARRAARIHEIADVLKHREPRLAVDVSIEEQYRNMSGGLSADSRIIEFGIEAIRRAGIEPDHRPLRGGTDGSNLTAKGLPSPNIFIGGCNYHGPAEWVSTRAMALSVCTILNLAQLWAGV